MQARRSAFNLETNDAPLSFSFLPSLLPSPPAILRPYDVTIFSRTIAYLPSSLFIDTERPPLTFSPDY